MAGATVGTSGAAATGLVLQQDIQRAPRQQVLTGKLDCIVQRLQSDGVRQAFAALVVQIFKDVAGLSTVPHSTGRACFRLTLCFSDLAWWGEGCGKRSCCHRCGRDQTKVFELARSWILESQSDCARKKTSKNQNKLDLVENYQGGNLRCCFKRNNVMLMSWRISLDFPHDLATFNLALINPDGKKYEHVRDFGLFPTKCRGM